MGRRPTRTARAWLPPPKRCETVNSVVIAAMMKRPRPLSEYGSLGSPASAAKPPPEP